MTLAKKLKIARQHLKEDQKKMASAVSVGYRQWQRYEQGESTPGGKVFKALAELGFNTNWFFTEDESIPMLINEATAQPSQQSANAIFDDLGMPEGMSLLAKIYSSEDTVLIRAINANLMAFGEAIDNKVAVNDLRNENIETRARIDTLEKKLANLERMLSEEEDHGQGTANVA